MHILILGDSFSDTDDTYFIWDYLVVVNFDNIRMIAFGSRGDELLRFR